MIWPHTEQYRGQIFGLYPIVSSYGHDDCMIDLDELLGIAGLVILFDVLGLEVLWPDNRAE
jgi:hypothetical protein